LYFVNDEQYVLSLSFGLTPSLSEKGAGEVTYPEQTGPSLLLCDFQRAGVYYYLMYPVLTIRCSILKMG